MKKLDLNSESQINHVNSSDKNSTQKSVVDMSSFKHYYSRVRNNPKLILACLCAAGVVQGMIFTNVVISTIERRFGLDSTQSGLVAGSYDIGSLIAIVPITYFGGRPTASKPRYISAGMFMIALGSFTFMLPHFTTESYLQTLSNSMNLEETKINSSSLNDGKLCRPQTYSANAASVSSFDNHHPLINQYDGSQSQLDSISHSNSSFEEYKRDEGENDGSLSQYRYVFLLAQICHGIGASALISLGVTYLDESVNKKDAPLFIGIFEASFVLGPAIGYVVGGKLLSLFTEFYRLHDLANLKNFSDSTRVLIKELSPTSPQWIGAWWLGFLMIVVLALIMTFILALFPAKLRQEDTENEDEIDASSKQISKSSQIEKDEDVLHVNKCDYGKVKDMPKVIYQLITNATYVAMSFGATMDAFLLAGMAAFLPKYLESQFDLSPGDAAITVGIIVVPGGAGGTLLGGYLMKRFGLDRTGSIKMYLLCQAAILPLYFGFMYHCPTGMYAGVNYNINNAKTDSANFQVQNSFNTGCQNNCTCTGFVKHEGTSMTVFSPTYEPVCSLLDKVTYYSPCHAGCQFETTYENQTAYYGCSCLQSKNNSSIFDLKNNVGIGNFTTTEKLDSDDLKRALGIVLHGECQRESCSSIPLAVIIFFQVLFTFMGTMPGLVASLRSVEPIQRSLALGLQTLLIRGLGTVPGPIIFGYLIDITCLMWHNTVLDEAKVILDAAQSLNPSSKNMFTEDTKNGSCRVYDNTTMSQNVMFVALGWKTMSTIFMTIALYFSKKSDQKAKNAKQVSSITHSTLEEKKNRNSTDAEDAV